MPEFFFRRFKAFREVLEGFSRLHRSLRDVYGDSGVSRRYSAILKVVLLAIRGLQQSIMDIYEDLREVFSESFQGVFKAVQWISGGSSNV